MIAMRKSTSRPSALERIVDLEIAKVGARPGFVARAIRLAVSAAARTRLAALGYDPKLGARPLRRTIEDRVVAPLADRMAGDPLWRDVTVRIYAATEQNVGDLSIP
jgi:ATP-dependent Clp protease ATP-binding subunit ClpC